MKHFEYPDFPTPITIIQRSRIVFRSILRIMKLAQILLGAFDLLSITSLACAQLSNITTPSLNLTAIAGSNGSSVIECWQLPGFMSSAVAGTAGALNLFLGEMANASYTVIPSRFDGGLHRAPAPQYVEPFHLLNHSSNSCLSLSMHSLAFASSDALPGSCSSFPV